MIAIRINRCHLLMRLATRNPVTLTSTSVASASARPSRPQRFASQKAVESAHPAAPTAPLCDCLKPAVQRTVVKRGATHGRLFWGCSAFNADKKGCSFFKWVGDAPLKPSTAAAAPAGPTCKCGEPSVMLTVSRPGVNFGRTFYRCTNGLVNLGTEAKESCDFFQWIDPVVPAGAAAPDAPPVPAAAAAAADASDAAVPLCSCNKPAVLLRVTKASPNVGRRFLRCADSNCGKFFVWVDV
jgi:hypothetical protein